VIWRNDQINLAASMATFGLRYPGVAMTLRSGLLDELVAQLDAGTLDVVIGPEHAGPGAPVATCELIRLPKHPPITVITPSKQTAPATGHSPTTYGTRRDRISLTLMTDRK
jgi:DNA-binding transcriptional LysR family regulator